MKAEYKRLRMSELGKQERDGGARIADSRGLYGVVAANWSNNVFLHEMKVFLSKSKAETVAAKQSKTQARSTGIPLWKRALDFSVILFMLPGVLLVGGIVALMIKLGSPGPVLFRQKRVGYKGNEFTCFKFRTMKVDAEIRSHQEHTRSLIQSKTPMVKLDAHKDPRLIPFGSVLRATGLDELPQLLNVLRGEMSIVGPRPCLGYEFELHKAWQRHRYDAAPGLTGLWQVSGKNRTTFDEMIRFDIRYSRKSSLWLDLQIMVKTLPALLAQCRETRALKSKQSAAAPLALGKIG